MNHILKFFLEVAKLKNVKRKGISFYGVKNPDSATDHTFRSAMMAWVFGTIKKDLDLEKMIKLILIHDIYKIYLGDATPYAGLLPKDKKKRAEFVKRWRRLFQARKEERYEKKYAEQYKVLRKMYRNLPEEVKKEAISLQEDYTKRMSPESKFVAQIDLLEDLLEALEQYKKNKRFPTRPWWEHADEVISDPLLLDFLKAVEKEEIKDKRKREKKGK